MAGMDPVYAFIEQRYGAGVAWDLQAELDSERGAQCDDQWLVIKSAKPT